MDSTTTARPAALDSIAWPEWASDALPWEPRDWFDTEGADWSRGVSYRTPDGAFGLFGVQRWTPTRGAWCEDLAVCSDFDAVVAGDGERLSAEVRATAGILIAIAERIERFIEAPARAK